MASLRIVVTCYLKHESTGKGLQAQQADRRRAELWLSVLGGESDPHEVSQREWSAFVRERSTGSIDARGHRVATNACRPVRPRTVQADLFWLRSVFAWATRWRTENGFYLMREDPLRGLRAPRERNPRRPVATAERYQALRAVTDQVLMEVRWHGQREKQRSYLSELLDLAHHTGRRLSAICRLRHSDLCLEIGPYGSIRWPARSDKLKRELVVPLSPAARAAIDRLLDERRGRDAAPLFPSPSDPMRPISRHLADAWLRRAEQIAGLEPQPGSLWHAYRRGWATARKHLPDVDVAAAGGWKDATTLKTVYQQPDAEGMLAAVVGEAAVGADHSRSSGKAAVR